MVQSERFGLSIIQIVAFFKSQTGVEAHLEFAARNAIKSVDAIGGLP